MEQNQTTAMLGAAADVAPVVELGSGAVNFENNIVSDSTVRAAQAAEAEVVEETTIGNSRVLGHQPEPVQVLKPEPAKATMHTITASINITLNTGLTFLQGLKELKSVDIERSVEDASTVEKFNFYNPFVKADKDRQTGEGLLRKTFSSIAEMVHSVLGREVVYLGGGQEITAAIANLVESVREKLVAKWPLPADYPVLELELSLDDGTIIPRPVQFGELFSLSSWVVSSEADENCVVTHTVVFNIGLNIGALYDSSEPHSFVRRAHSFMEAQLLDAGLEGLVDFNVNYAFDSMCLVDPNVRDVLDILLSEDGYSLVSKAAVTSGSTYWAPSSIVNNLFGFGCDLILRSPDATQDVEEDAAE